MPARKTAARATSRKPAARRRTAAAVAAPSAPDPSRELALLAVQAGLDKKAEVPAILDVRALSSYTDYVVLLSADNRRQIEAVGQEVEARLRAHGRRALGLEGNGDSGWLLLDFGDVVVHLFSPDTRAFYDLEGLWADAPRVQVPADGSPREGG